MKAYGKKTWLIGDAFWDSHSNGIYPSHESICVLNTSERDAHITMTLFFEDREKKEGFDSFCGAGKTHHIRMDKIVSRTGEKIPQDVPYAVLLESDVPLVAQYSRCDTAQEALTFMTTMAYPVDGE